MYERELRVAIDAVESASRLCKQVRSELVEVEAHEKHDRSPVTVADYGAQAVICQRLHRELPSDPIVAEEDSDDLRGAAHEGTLAQVVEFVGRLEPDATAKAVCDWIDAGTGGVAERFWTLDPIDGTKGFLRGDQYAVALALIVDGLVQVGVLGCPALPHAIGEGNASPGVLFAAVRGEGSHQATLGEADFARVRVLPSAEGATARFVESVESGHGNAALQERVARAAGIAEPPLKLDSQVKYGAIARGDAVLYLRLPSDERSDYREKIWDHAAGCLIVEEAGGRVTDMAGRRLEFASRSALLAGSGVVASNGTIHEAVLEALAEL